MKENKVTEMEINHFIFEQGDHSVLLDCNLKTASKNTHTTFHISQTDLNAMITKLALSGVNAMDFCETYDLSNGKKLYEINLKKIDLEKRSLRNVSFYNPATKILA